MKKLLILMFCVFAAFTLWSCREDIKLENAQIDYDEMDKEFGQEPYNSDKTDSESYIDEDFKDDISEIKELTESYTSVLLDNDAKKCVSNFFPDMYFGAIEKSERMNRANAVKYAENKVNAIFSSFKSSHPSMVSLKSEYGYSTSIVSVSHYSQENTLINTYKKLGVDISAVCDVTFLISVDDSAANSNIRFCKLSDNKWYVDMSCFEL